MKRDAETLVEHIFIPIKSVRDLEGISEETLMEETLEAFGGSEGIDSSKCSEKRDPDASEMLMEPLFVAIKSEPCFDETSEETFVGEDDGRSKITEDISRENNQQSHISYSPFPCSSQIASSTPSLSEVVEMDTQKHFWRKPFPSSCDTVLSPSTGCQTLLAVASCSTRGDAMNEKETADSRCFKEQAEPPVTEEGQEQHSEQSEDASCVIHEETCLPQGTVQSGLLRNSTDKRPFDCTDCGRSFTIKSSLSRHMRKHTGDRPYKCSVCPESFTDCGSLTFHKRKHTGDRPYKCSQCGKSFTNSSNLIEHMRVHTGERPYKCSQCGKSFTQSNILIKHMCTHTGDRPYKCSECVKSFTSNSNLTAHMHKHTGERPYRCSQCGKSFTESSTLTKHMRVHTGERPYKCTECERCFAQIGNLTTHMYTHIGDQPYKCSHCGKSFTNSSKLTVHMQTHTGV